MVKDASVHKVSSMGNHSIELDALLTVQGTDTNPTNDEVNNLNTSQACRLGQLQSIDSS